MADLATEYDRLYVELRNSYGPAQRLPEFVCDELARHEAVVASGFSGSMTAAQAITDARRQHFLNTYDRQIPPGRGRDDTSNRRGR